MPKGIIMLAALMAAAALVVPTLSPAVQASPVETSA